MLLADEACGPILSASMRRLAKQSRNDRVLSARDYQTIQERQGTGFKLDSRRGSRIVFCADVRRLGNTGFIGAGGYLKGDSNAKLQIHIIAPDGNHKEVELSCATKWRGFGLAVQSEHLGIMKLAIQTPPGLRVLELWGLDGGAVELPESALAQFAQEADPLNSSHLTPETLYLRHAESVGMDEVANDWDRAAVAPDQSSLIHVKKCAYCQRFLPIDRKRPSALSFHKHNAKVTGHQNECRSCKKWRINDTFNPKRTVDQLHESSVITRERRLFLREPEILAKIKDRHGDGLKSIVWKRFDKKCFRCKKPLTLGEVELDHTRPLAYLWPIDEHATCLCAACNGIKREHFPVDVYSSTQIDELAAITGLAPDELVAKRINERELARIVADIVTYAREWDPRTFNATARKVRELRNDIDLFDVLRRASPRVHGQLQKRLAERPATE